MHKQRLPLIAITDTESYDPLRFGNLYLFDFSIGHTCAFPYMHMKARGCLDAVTIQTKNIPNIT